MQKPVISKRSKRSSKVALTTMMALSGGAMLTACGDDPAAPSANAAVKDKLNKVEVYQNSFACAKATGKTRDECDVMRDAALERSAREAPKFQAIQDCEAKFGQGKCVANDVTRGTIEGEEELAQQSRTFSPFVLAWFARGKDNVPLYSDKRGGYQTANGTRLGFAGEPGKYLASDRAQEEQRSTKAVIPVSRSARAAGFGRRSTASKGWSLGGKSGGSAASGGSRAGSKGG